jgi:hypothetical protein
MDLELTPTTTDPEGIAAWTKPLQTNIQTLTLQEKSGCTVKRKWPIGKDSKIGAIQNYNSNLPTVMDFTSCMMQGPFLMKTMELGTMEW